MASPLDYMLGGAFGSAPAPSTGMNLLAPLLRNEFAPEPPPEPAPPPEPEGFHPLLTEMLRGSSVPGSLYERQLPPQPDIDTTLRDDPVDPYDPQLGYMQLPPDIDIDPRDLREPERRDKPFKQHLMEAIVPLLAAGVIGKFGGGMAGATGLLGGVVKGRDRMQDVELEQAKIDASRRERALSRQQLLQQQRWERMVKQTQAVEGIYKQLAEFDDIETGKEWLKTVAPTYAPMGIDTTKMVSAVLPGMQRKIQKDAQSQYETILDIQKKSLKKDQDLDLEKLHNIFTLTFRGKDMTLGDLAKIAGVIPGGVATTENYANAGKIDTIIKGMFEDFEKMSGRPPSREERNGMVLEANKQLAASKVDPSTAALRKAMLQKLMDERALKQSTNDWATKYSPAQQTAARNFAGRYQSASKDFIVKAQSLDTIMSSASRTTGSAQAQMALVFAFMKMLDSNSVVRETEYAKAAETAGVPQRIRNYWNQLVDGRFLDKSQILGMVEEAKGIYGFHRKTHDRIANDFAQAASRQEINPWDVITDFNASNDPMQLHGFPRQRKVTMDEEGNFSREPATEAAPAPAPSPAPAAGGTPPASDIRIGKPKAGVVKGQRVYIGDPPSWKTVTEVRPDGTFDAY